MLLENRIALVTGASRGIGKAVSDKLGAEGACVIGTATSEGGANAITQRFSDAGVKGKGMLLDVTNPDQVSEVIDAITGEYGAVEILVNNAGITRDNLFMRLKEDEWTDIIDTNLTAVFRVCKACIRPMVKARYGRIVNIGSVVGSTGNPGQTNYAAAKAGLTGFSKSLARELGSRGITVNTIAPGFIESDMTNELSDDQKEALVGSIALGKMGQADDVAHAAVFLASAMGDYVTGQTLHINGGMFMP